uniref:Mitochondrial carrier protein n=1 Tax=Leptocylindrus danicus TaxID=163516 RepID=A0A7S2K8S8_9STRA|mmetsp:Transcript_19899/g.29587  ORF Transcript_19899/g.29587 Transcript_19899/m.29587 type:complete len:378 (+) Transcript_19899:70-1203(+)
MSNTLTTSDQQHNDVEQEIDWEEWDGNGSFLVHCMAGGIAGIVEHTATFPMDTIKTHMQSYCAICPNKDNCATTAERIYGRTNGIRGFYRGVQTMLYGCVPAHALYFSSYEVCKSSFSAASSNSGDNLMFMTPLQGAIAGCVSTFLHDGVMTPMDTLKQRMQLGHYTSVGQGFASIVRTEGAWALYRSFPVTLATNLPYGSIMFAVNESLKEVLTHYHDAAGSPPTTTTYLLAGSGAGAVAAALTTPLDRLKTKLQTQYLANAMPSSHRPAMGNVKQKIPGSNKTLKPGSNIGIVMGLHTNPIKPSVCNAAEVEVASVNLVKYAGVMDALKSILREEGAAGLFRGVVPRLCSHTPAVAISWTTYETMKKYFTSLEKF